MEQSESSEQQISIYFYSSQDFINDFGIQSIKNIPKSHIISQCSYGTIYKFYHQENQQPYAVKVIQTQDQEDNILQQMKEQIHQQINSHQKIQQNSQNINKNTEIINFYKVYRWILNQENVNQNKNVVTEFEYRIVYEYCPNSLEKVLKSNIKQYNQEQVKFILMQCLNGLKVLKQNQILHQNLKPKNILLKTKEQVKLTGFGSNKYIDKSKSVANSVPVFESKKGKNVLNSPMASPQSLYESLEEAIIPPEYGQVLEKYWKNGEQQDEIDCEKADIYSLGVIAIQMLSRSQIYQISDQSKKNQAEQNKLYIQYFNDNIKDQDLKKMLINMINLNISDRYTIQECLETLNGTGIQIDQDKLYNKQDFQKEFALKSGQKIYQPNYLGGAEVYSVKSELNNKQYAIKRYPNIESGQFQKQQQKQIDLTKSVGEHINIVKKYKQFIWEDNDEETGQKITIYRESIELAKKDLYSDILERFEQYQQKMMTASIDSSTRNSPFFSENQIIFIGIQCLVGLVHLKKHGILHGNIQPSNILLFSEEQIKLNDFSFSRDIRDTKNQDFSSNKGVVLNFIAPEIKNNKVTNFEVAEIFSLGLTLLCAANLLAKEQLVGLNETQGQNTIDKEIAKLSNHKLQLFLAKMTRYQPENRFQTLEECHQFLLLDDDSTEGTNDKSYEHSRKKISSQTNIDENLLKVTTEAKHRYSLKQNLSKQDEKKELIDSIYKENLSKKSYEDVFDYLERVIIYNEQSVIEQKSIYKILDGLSKDKQNITAYSWKGLCLLFGRGVSKSERKAFDVFKFTDQKDDDVGQYGLAWVYQYGLASQSQDHKKAYSSLRNAAQKHNRRAITQLGYMYDHGYGVQQDFQQAAKNYQQASSKNCRWALYNLASCYMNGRGVMKNYQKGVQFYLQSAQLGNQTAFDKLTSLKETELLKQVQINK